MALDERYFISGPLDQIFFDKDTGLPLANGTITFYRDSSRNELKRVYELTGDPGTYTYTSLGTQITLSSIGTIVNGANDPTILYFYPYDADGNLDLYYIVCKNSGGTTQWTREAWPNITAENDPTGGDFPVANQLSNPQFTRVFLNEGLSTTYTVTGASQQVFKVAPNWDMVISGTGTVMVEQVANTGNDDIVTSPPYSLDVTVSAGVTECLLRQRFRYNSGLWASTTLGGVQSSVYLTGFLVARNEGVGTTSVEMFYDESTGGSPVSICSDSFEQDYKIIRGTTANPIPQSNNTDSGFDGYVDIYLSFLPATHVRVTSFQVIPTTNSNTGNITQYDPDSTNREQAYLGDYYIPALEAKRTDSFLHGWDFPMNPTQFGSTGNISTMAGYIWDQTIGESNTANVAYARNTVTGGLQLTNSGASEGYYIMQYLSGREVKRMLGTRLAVNVDAYKGSVGDDVTMRVYLYRGSSGASIPTLPTSIGTIAATGLFTKTAANWTLIERGGLDTPTATLTEIATNDELATKNTNYGFSQFEITSASEIGDTDKFAIVVTFTTPTASTVVTVNSVSVVPGDIPTAPLPKSQEEVLKECEYYYEKSYNLGVDPGTSTNAGCMTVTFDQDDANLLVMEIESFFIHFRTAKINNTYDVTLYNLVGTADRVTGRVYENGSLVIPDNTINSNHFSSTGLLGEKAVCFVPAIAKYTFTGSITTSPFVYMILFHYVIDARLGV